MSQCGFVFLCFHFDSVMLTLLNHHIELIAIHLVKYQQGSRQMVDWCVRPDHTIWDPSCIAKDHKCGQVSCTTQTFWFYFYAMDL